MNKEALVKFNMIMGNVTSWAPIFPEQAIHDVRRALEVAPEIPDGWIPAPLEPLDCMIEAGCGTQCRECHADCHQGPYAEIYRAMIEAVPGAPNHGPEPNRKPEVAVTRFSTQQVAEDRWTYEAAETRVFGANTTLEDIMLWASRGGNTHWRDLVFSPVTEDQEEQP